MTWDQFARARRLLAEERVGVPQREHQRAELAQVEATKAAIRRTQGK